MMGVFVQVNDESPMAARYPLGYVFQENGCWEWVGECGWNGSCLEPGRGYGSWKGRPAHRVMYELVKGPIPAGLELDHLCRNPACVNPDHLEAVTHRENNRRMPRYVRMRWHLNELLRKELGLAWDADLPLAVPEELRPYYPNWYQPSGQGGVGEAFSSVRRREQRMKAKVANEGAA